MNLKELRAAKFARQLKKEAQDKPKYRITMQVQDMGGQVKGAVEVSEITAWMDNYPSVSPMPEVEISEVFPAGQQGIATAQQWVAQNVEELKQKYAPALVLGSPQEITRG